MLGKFGYMKTVYIIGSKGIPAKYGGFETFVEKLYSMNIKSSLSSTILQIVEGWKYREWCA